MLELKCQHCGETFVAKRRDAKWCSLSCCKRANYVRNREATLLRQKNHYECNKEEICQKARVRRAADPERTRNWNRNWYAKHSDRLCEKTRARRAADPEKVRKREMLLERERKNRIAEGEMNIYLNNGGKE